MYEKLQERLDQNIERVRRLVGVYDQLSGEGSGRRAVSDTDVLRAAVVFLHATLEDSLRTVVEHAYPDASQETLNSIPLARPSGHGRAVKFQLGDLARHRDLTVRELIDASVESYLERKTFNNTKDIADLVKNFRGDIALVERHFGELQEMMERRHQIVHRADENPSEGTGQYAARSLGKPQVERWIDVVEAFTSDLTVAYLLS